MIHVSNGKAWRVGREGDGVGGLRDDPRALGRLLVEDVAVEAALAVVEVRARLVQLVGDRQRHDGRRDDLRVRMLEAGARAGAVVLEHDRGAEAPVTAEVDEPVAIRAHDVLDGGLGERRQRRVVVG
jgi:hypothetical protein